MIEPGTDESAEPVQLRSRSRVRERWANGQGFTSPVAIDPKAEPRWRINIADIPGDCDFSLLPEVDRIFLLLTERSLVLELGPSVTVEPLRPIRFAGESAPRCRSAGPARALNVLLRRGSTQAEVRVLEIDGPATVAVPTAVTVVVVMVAGRMKWPGGADLEAGGADPEAGDAVMFRPSDRQVELPVTGQGRLAVVTVGTR